MAMTTFDAITVLTLGVIGFILLLYILVLRKEGWLKGEMKKSESHFLCPNQKCRKVFEKPVWLTDLSTDPPQSYQACPHCGVSIQFFSNSFHTQSNVGNEPQHKSLPLASEAKKSVDMQQYAEKVALPKSAESTKEHAKPSFQTNTLRSKDKTLNSTTPEPSMQDSHIQASSSRKLNEAPLKKQTDKPFQTHRSCVHFFGYIRTLPRNTPIPDECLGCQSIVECLASQKKIEA